MSYILDALKKSEGERSRQEKAQRQSLQNKPGQRERSISLFAWIATMLVVLLLLLLWWFWPTLSNVIYQARIQTNNEVVVDKPESNATNMSGDSATAVPATPEQSAQRDSVASDALYDEDAPLPPGNQIKELWQMPADFQAGVPALNFSFHVYSDTPENRTIIINDRRLKEGAMVTSKIRLRMITETGVILHAQGRFFHVDVYEQMYVPQGG